MSTDVNLGHASPAAVNEQYGPVQLETAEPGTRAIPTITCPCGFTVSGFDENMNRDAHADHCCPLDVSPARLQSPWHESVFSLWGMVIVVAIVIAVVEVLDILR